MVRQERMVGQRGVTLIEVMAAAALLSIGAFALLSGLRSAGLTTSRADRQTHAAAIAQRYVEQFRHRPDADPYHDSLTVPDDSDYQVEIDVTPYGETDELVQVQVAAWYLPSPEIRAEFSTVVRVEP